MLARKFLQFSKNLSVQKAGSFIFNDLLHQSNRVALSNQRKILTSSKVIDLDKVLVSCCNSVRTYSEHLSLETGSDGNVDHQKHITKDGVPDENLESFQVKKNLVFMRGLPYNASSEDIIKFFSSVNIKPCQIEIIYDSFGQPIGKAEVQFESEDDANRALKKHNAFVGHRYVELSRVPFPRMNAIKRQFSPQSSIGTTYTTPISQSSNRFISSGYWVRLSGMPYEATAEDVIEFFKPLGIVPETVEMKYTRRGYPNGLCSVMFKTEKEALLSLQNDNKYIGKRYIRVSSSLNADRMAQRFQSKDFERF